MWGGAGGLLLLEMEGVKGGAGRLLQLDVCVSSGNSAVAVGSSVILDMLHLMMRATLL